MKMLFSFHSHMLNVSLILESIKFFMTIKVQTNTLSGYSLMFSFTAFK